MKAGSFHSCWSLWLLSVCKDFLVILVELCVSGALELCPFS
jgi:hypothetical protein